MVKIIKYPTNDDTAGNIQALFLATEPPAKQKEVLLRLGFEAFNHNVYAIRPKNMSREECQQLLDTKKQPLVGIDTSPVKNLEEILDWLGE